MRRGQTRRRRKAKVYNATLNENSTNKGDCDRRWIIIHVCFTWEYSTRNPWKVYSNTQLWTLAKGGGQKKVKQETKIFYGRNGVPKSTFHSVFSISCWVATFVWLQRKFFEPSTAYTCFKFKSHSTFFIFKKTNPTGILLIINLADSLPRIFILYLSNRYRKTIKWCLSYPHVTWVLWFYVSF